MQDQVFDCPMAFVDDNGNVVANSPIVFELDPSQNTCGFLSPVDGAHRAVSTGKLLEATPNNNQVGTCTLAYRPHGPASSSTPSLVEQVVIGNAAPYFTHVGIANYLVKNVYPSTNGGFTELLQDADVQTNEETEGTAIGQLFGTYSETRENVTEPCSNYGQVKIDGATGRVLFKQDQNYYGTCNLGIQFDDGNALSGNSRVSVIVPVHVLERNSPPAIIDGPGLGTPRVENCGEHCYVSSDYDFQLNANQGGDQYNEKDQHLTVIQCTSSNPALLMIPYCQVDPVTHQFDITLTPLGAPGPEQSMPTVTIQVQDDGYDEFANSRDASGNWVITRVPRPLTSNVFTFQVDTQQYTQKFHPAIAVSRPACMMCHAKVQGDVFTDMARGSLVNPADYFPSNRGLAWAETAAALTIGWASVDSISGGIYVPNTPLPVSPVDTNPGPGNPTWEDEYFYFWGTNGVGTTLQQFMSTVGMVSSKATYPTNSTNRYVSNASVSDTIVDAGVSKSIQDIAIRFPLAADIQAMDQHGAINWTSPAPQVAYAGRLPSDPALAAASLSGLGVVQTAVGTGAPSSLPFVTNTGVVTCQGDVIIKGTLVLYGAAIRTSDIRPCRIHVVGTTFIYGIDGNSDALSVLAAPGMNVGTLQITSTMGVFMGLGPGMLQYWESHYFAGSWGDRTSLFKPSTPYAAIAAAAGITEALDGCHGQPAMGCGGDARAFNFSRVVLNGPYVVSRYLGQFQGAVIADFATFRIDNLNYAYDPALSAQVLFPRLRAIRTVDRPAGLSVFDVKTR